MNSAQVGLSLGLSLGSTISNKEDGLIPQENVFEMEECEETQMNDSGIHSSPSTGGHVIESTEMSDWADPERDRSVDVSENENEDGNGGVAETDSALSNLYIDEDDHISAGVTETCVILCSNESLDEAKRFSQDVTNNLAELDIKPCNDQSDFSSEILHPCVYKTMYILVDSNICDVMMKKRRLRDSVDEFFEEFAGTSKVYLVNRLPADETVRYERLKTQLPESVNEYKEIPVSSIFSDSDLPQNRGEISESRQRRENTSAGAKESEIDDITAGNFVMVGSHCRLNIAKMHHQIIAIKQDGSQNIINVQIVPATTTSKLTVVIKTDPADPNLERQIIHEIKEDLEVINICLRHMDGSIIDIRNGSVVIEIEVKPGEPLRPDRLESMLRAILQENVAFCIPKGTSLTADMDVKNVIPISKLLQYVSELQSDEDIHKNCVAKAKYEAVVEELEELKRSLNDVTVSVISGDITEEKTEVIVNSTNPRLKLSDGDLSNDILEAAGSDIQDQCKSRHSSGVKVGEIAVTEGGNLNCKNIYHITLSDNWSSKQDASEQSLRGVMIKCLQEADQSGHRSISFPALGTGKLKYDPERVAEIMYDVCLSFRSTGLKEVRLVVHPACSGVHKIFTDVDRRKKRALDRSQSMPSTLHYDQQINKKAVTDIPRKIQLNWLKGDISKQKVGVVVNSTVPKLKLSSGPLSQAILNAAGNEIQTECEVHYPQGIKEGELAFTSGGRKWNHVYHTVLWPWSDTASLQKNYKDLITDCLLRACDYKENSIAFPLLGTGVLHYPPEKVAKWLREAVEEFQSTHPDSTVRQVNIVIHPKDSNSIEALKRMGIF